MMEGAVRLFAAEFSQATLTLPGEDERSPSWTVSPSGAKFRQVFLMGALTEAREEADLLVARLADPTGGFDLVCSGRETPAAGMLRTLPRPSFISVAGRAQVYRRGNDLVRSIRPEHVRAVDRTARDQWVLGTARETLDRLGRMQTILSGGSGDGPEDAAARHYRLTPARLGELAAVLEEAVAGIRPPGPAAPPQADARAMVIGLLEAQPGPRGVAVQEIIDTLGAQGVFQDLVLRAIEGLVADDECYQPQKGYIRLL
jgi:hypothetical protein